MLLATLGGQMKATGYNRCFFVHFHSMLVESSLDRARALPGLAPFELFEVGAKAFK